MARPSADTGRRWGDGVKYIYIASQYSHGDREANARRSMEAAVQLIKAGFHAHSPLWTHFIETQIEPLPYETWMRLDFAWLRKCEALIRLPGPSAGADREVQEAHRLGIPVYASVEEFLTAQGEPGRVVVLGGLSGAGKTTAGELLEREGWIRMVTVTTRAPRAGEVDGRDYHFLTEEEFDQADLGERTRYVGNGDRYGILRADMEAARKRHVPTYAILNADGLQQLREYYGLEKVMGIFLLARRATLEARMQQRGDKPDSIKRRLERYEEELGSGLTFDRQLAAEHLSPEDATKQIRYLVE